MLRYFSLAAILCMSSLPAQAVYVGHSNTCPGLKDTPQWEAVRNGAEWYLGRARRRLGADTALKLPSDRIQEDQQDVVRAERLVQDVMSVR